MDTIFLDHQFWKLRASISEPLAPKTLRLSESPCENLPHPVTKVPASHFEPRISNLPFPFNLFMNVQLILIGGRGPFPATCVTPLRSSRSGQFVINSNRQSKIDNRRSTIHLFTLLSHSVHAPFTLFHAIFRGGGGGRLYRPRHSAVFLFKQCPASFKSEIEDRNLPFAQRTFLTRQHLESRSDRQKTGNIMEAGL